LIGESVADFLHIIATIVIKLAGLIFALWLSAMWILIPFVYLLNQSLKIEVYFCLAGRVLQLPIEFVEV